MTKKERAVLLALGVPVVLLVSLWEASHLRQGLLPGLFQTDAFTGSLSVSPAALKVAGGNLLLFLLLFFGLSSGKREKRTLEEHGSASWGDAQSLGRRYRNPHRGQNRILSEKIALGLDSARHGRNLNVLLIGGAGSGKSRGYVRPNLQSLPRESLVILDPKSELLRATGSLLQEEGYRIRVLDLCNMEKSHSYNPFAYLKRDEDAQKLVTNLFQNTSGKDGTKQDPFWDHSAQMLLMSLILYLKEEAPVEEQNFEMVLEMIRAGEVQEENEQAPSALDLLFDRLELRNPTHPALKYYRSYRSGSAKTLKSIQITLLSRLEKFNLSALAALTRQDEMELEKIGTEKTALFAVIPDSDTSFNFLVGILYTQLFQQLYALADRQESGRLPVPVHFLMDEFANVGLPDQFDKLLATMRSRGISVSIILQNLTQLKTLYPKEWESILGNCDTLVYLGGNEPGTHETLSKMLGKQTLEGISGSRSRGRGGSVTRSQSFFGRELMMPDEIRRMDNRNCLVLIRGEAPVLDRKIRLQRFPNTARTTDGTGNPFEYGKDTRSRGGVSLLEIQGKETASGKTLPKESPVLIWEGEELLEKLSEKEETNEKK